MIIWLCLYFLPTWGVGLGVSATLGVSNGTGLLCAHDSLEPTYVPKPASPLNGRYKYDYL